MKTWPFIFKKNSLVFPIDLFTQRSSKSGCKCNGCNM